MSRLSIAARAVCSASPGTRSISVFAFSQINRPAAKKTKPETARAAIESAEW
jgi:hypothetical protein